ncbi:MAG: 50S ribosomal protein L17 [Acetobacteraceae bacterium]|nr:50S ribosomal protein L17 [Acetobacteraceae bacterium]
MRGYRKLGRPSDQRWAMLRSLVTALLAKEKIVTTLTRAREVSSLAEKLITSAKGGGLAARRRAMGVLLDEDVARKLFENVAPRYKDRSGGYTRVVRLAPRQGDAAPMAQVELL